VFLFVGRFVEKKGLPVLRRLAERIPDVTWLFAGWGSLDPRQWNLPNVRVFSSLTWDVLKTVYHAADLLVLPSVGEGLPLVIQEAMACGTPALVSTETVRADGKAASLIFCERVDGLGSEEAVAALWLDRIRALLKNPEELGRLRARVAAFARKHWSWEEDAARYTDIIEELLSKHRS
jgi:glycosyltransferase involved in cell wall biosynthesis